ncbi:DUF7558 family protein [Halopiger aswanensis]
MASQAGLILRYDVDRRCWCIPLTGYAFCDAPLDTEIGEAHTWGQDERITRPICVDCAIQTESDPDERNHVACDGCGACRGHARSADVILRRTGDLEGPLQLCARCSPGGLATYWTRDLEEHLMVMATE